MDKTLRTAATGLNSQQRYVEIISNNISNVNTTGFKKVRPEFQDLLYETIKPAGNTQRSNSPSLNDVQIGSGTELSATTKLFSQGDVKTTNNKLDVAINGEGFFVVTKPDNSMGYTRDGSFQLDKDGQIITSQGFKLDPGFNIPTDAVDIQITRDGIVKAILDKGTTDSTLGQIQLARFINPAGLKSVGDNLYQETPASGPMMLEQPGHNNTGELIQNSLEQSNVDIVEEMVNMIMAQRAYELNSKSVKTAEDILTSAVNLKR